VDPGFRREAIFKSSRQRVSLNSVRTWSGAKQSHTAGNCFVAFGSDTRGLIDVSLLKGESEPGALRKRQSRGCPATVGGKHTAPRAAQPVITKK
jgi:hypothetical protein